MSDLRLDGMALADGVVETIIGIALQNVEGVAGVASGAAGILGALGAKQTVAGIGVLANADNTLAVEVHIEAVYGYALPEIAERVRSAIADAVQSQVGVQVSSVDVYIDGIHFA